MDRKRYENYKLFEEKWEEYLSYLYSLSERYYNDCSDIDTLIQDTLTALIIKQSQGEKIEYPKGFLSAVLKNKHNSWLREKYKKDIIEFSDAIACKICNEIEEKEILDFQNTEYEAVRREIGRLIGIYREVTVRYYVHGQSVEQIAAELNIPKGTVLSRLSYARNQIKEGLENMEKYSEISYEPKRIFLGIWGYSGLNKEPFSLIHTAIEENILILAYENPVSIRGIADTMGMPCAYIEPIVETLVKGELMGKTSGGLVYTRCFMQKAEDSFGNISAQETLAKKHAVGVWEIVWKHLEPLAMTETFTQMSEKQKATMTLFIMNQTLNQVIMKISPNTEKIIKEPPERPNGGKWLAGCKIYEKNQKHIPYHGSGPVFVAYRNENEEKYLCQMFDCQSLFGATHWAYKKFKYKISMQDILLFYASFLPCDVKTDNVLLYELVPEFEKLGILRRDTDGELRLDIPALTFEEERTYWKTACVQIKKELSELLTKELTELWRRNKTRVPKHVDEAPFFQYAGMLTAYIKAQLLVIVDQGLMPYPVVVGKTPLIYLNYLKGEQ